jgi:hypothetical protein
VRNNGDNKPKPFPTPYKQLAPVAHLVKAVVQMFIGIWAVYAAAAKVINGDATNEALFQTVGHALALAAVVELAYTLFTPGADETLDPLMLGLSSLLLIRLGLVSDKGLDWRDAVPVVLYIGCLAGLFAVRRYLAELHDEGETGVLHVIARIWKRSSISRTGGARSSRTEDVKIPAQPGSPTAQQASEPARSTHLDQ